MTLPSMSGVGRLTQDPELRFSPSGLAICTVNIAFNSRKKDASGDWVDGDVFFVRGTCFKQLAESVAESLVRGTEVNVSGRLKTEQWQDKQTGDKRSATALLIDAIGPNLAFATARVSKVERGSETRSGGSSSGPSDDPWGAAPPASSTPATDEPPF